jgi:hypothetical protein
LKSSFKKFYIILNTLILLLGNSPSAQAWEHEVSLGYGLGSEINQHYQNNGFFLSGKLIKFRADSMLFFTIDPTLAHLTSNADEHTSTNTAALAIAGRAYFANPDSHRYRPYLGASIGPNYLTSRYLGELEQGSHLSFFMTGEAGMEIGSQQKSVDINVHFTHYCNGYLATPNQGFDIPLVLSIGYQF